MTKRKAAASKVGPKKIAKKQKKSSSKSKKKANPAGVRKEVSRMVESGAVAMARAVIDGGKGQLATMRYLFEIASIFPPDANTDAADPEEECLAKTLLRRLNIPEEPIQHDDDEETERPGENREVPVPAEDEAGEKNCNSEAGGEAAVPPSSEK